jgi:hypothetical protein
LIRQSQTPGRKPLLPFSIFVKLSLDVRRCRRKTGRPVLRLFPPAALLRPGSGGKPLRPWSLDNVYRTAYILHLLNFLMGTLRALRRMVKVWQHRFRRGAGLYAVVLAALRAAAAIPNAARCASLPGRGCGIEWLPRHGQAVYP